MYISNSQEITLLNWKAYKLISLQRNFELSFEFSWNHSFQDYDVGVRISWKKHAFYVLISQLLFLDK